MKEMEEREERREKESRRNNIVIGAKWKEAGSKGISKRKLEIKCMMWKLKNHGK